MSLLLSPLTLHRLYQSSRLLKHPYIKLASYLKCLKREFEAHLTQTNLVHVTFESSLRSLCSRLIPSTLLPYSQIHFKPESTGHN